MHNFLIPKSNILYQDPIYCAKTRYARHHNLSQLPSMTVRWGGITAFITFIFWLIMSQGGMQSILWRLQSSYTDTTTASIFSSFLIMGISFLLTLIMDIVNVIAASNSLKGMQNASHWDLIRLTNLSRQGIVQSEHTMAQIKVWRMFCVPITVRIMGFITLLIPLFVSIRSSYRFGYVDREEWFELLFVITTLFLVASIFIIENLWRMRAVTALGIFAATRSSSPNTRIVTGIASVVAMWISQGFFIIVTGFIALDLPVFEDLFDGTILGLWLTVTVTILLIGASIYFYYYTLRVTVLNEAARLVFRLD